MDFLAGTLWAFELAFVVLLESKDEFERFFAIIAIKLIARHKEPPRKAGSGCTEFSVYARGRELSRAYGKK